MTSNYTRKCPTCERSVVHINRDILLKSVKENRLCKSCCQKGKNFSIGHRTKISEQKQGVCHSPERKVKNALAQKLRYLNPLARRKTAAAIKLALHRPDVRKKHITALSKINFLGRAMDVGQLDLLEKWNRLGFKFEPNYQVHTDEFLCYLDGYDKKRNVVIEFDSKYHQKTYWKKKDIIRQKKVIEILNPEKFWRYDSVHKTIVNVLEK